MRAATPFGAILRDAVERTPGAVGGAFAASDGETVDSFSSWSETEWAILTAHFGVVLGHVQSALHTFHYGEAKLLVISHQNMSLLIRAVAEGYFALIAVEPPAHLGRAVASLERASDRLLAEMS